MPVLSRRSLFLGAAAIGAGALGAAAVLAPQAAAAAPLTRAIDLGEGPEIPVRSHYTPGIGEVFSATGSGAQHELRLLEIEDVAGVSADDENSFNLIFETDSADPAEGMYNLLHPAVPASDLYLSPVDLPTGVRRLQALVNRSA